MCFLKDIVTTKDGQTYTFAKVAGVGILLCFIAVSIWCYGFKGFSFDPAIWGGVLTTIYGTINAAIRATHITEPE